MALAAVRNFINGSHDGQNLNVHMFQEDIDRMKSWVRLHPKRETGGNLFGLWTANEEPVVHIVLGPAEGCKRTEVSFFQSVPYLERVGKVLANGYLLCHIGEWHSHHQLRLSEPSSGDSSTVIRNFPRGTCGFLLIIANIVKSGRTEFDVTLSPYLYREGRQSYLKGKIYEIPRHSPFRAVGRISSEIQQGEEKKRDEYMVYMFEQDQNMIKEQLRELSGSEHTVVGDLFGLWTTAKEPVIHLVLKPSDTQKEHVREENRQGQEALSLEYPSLQKVGRYALHCLQHPLENAHEVTQEEATSICHAFPSGGVFVVAHAVTVNEDKTCDEIGLAAYVYSGNPNECRTPEIFTIRGPKLFFENSPPNGKDYEGNGVQHENEKLLIDFDTENRPQSPNFAQHVTRL